MIHLTCENCETVYQLAASQLGADGRKVRCGHCKTIWFQQPIEDPDAPALLGDDDVAKEAKPDWLSANDAPAVDLDFIPLDKEQAAAESEQAAAEKTEKASKEEGEAEKDDSATLPEKAPDSAMANLISLQQQSFQIPVMTHRPMGMGAVQFGLFTFLLLAFSTMLGLLALRGTIMSHAPVMDAFYRPLGLGLSAPGEGFEISSMTAQDKVVNGQHHLSITADLLNATKNILDWPKLRIEAVDDTGAVVKNWDFANGITEGMPPPQTLAAHASLPLELSFNDAPDKVESIRIVAVTP